MNLELKERINRARRAHTPDVLRLVNAAVRAMDTESSRLELTVLGAAWLLGRLCHKFELGIEVCRTLAEDGYRYSEEHPDG